MRLPVLVAFWRGFRAEPRPCAPRKPRRSIQKTVFGSSLSITKPSCTCNCSARRDERENFFRLLRKLFQLGVKPVQRID